MSLESTTQKEVEELKDRWNKIDINVLWREGKENKIPTNKAITYAELLQQLWIVFELFDEPEFEDLKQAIGNAEVAAFAPSPPPLPAPCALSAPPAPHAPPAVIRGCLLIAAYSQRREQ